MKNCHHWFNVRLLALFILERAMSPSAIKPESVRDDKPNITSTIRGQTLNPPGQNHLSNLFVCLFHYREDIFHL